jgi:hypothetical protein
MQQLTNERNNAFLPGELGDRIDQCLLHTLTGPTFPHFFSQADFKGKTLMKSKEERPEFLPGELGVRTVPCQPTTKPDAPHFFHQFRDNARLPIDFLPGEPV